MPTSMTTAPGRTMSAVTNSGLPIATIRMSAERLTRGQVAGLGVADRHRRVAARALLDQQARHRLADDVRPAHDHRVARPWSRCPSGSASAARRTGVAGLSAVGSPMTSLPTFTGWKPSTSLAGSIGVEHPLAVDVLRQRELHQEAVDPGIGVEPVDDRRAARPRRSSPGRRIVSECIPASSHALPLACT